WSGFELESRDILGGADQWVKVTAAPVVNGDQYTVTVPALGTSQFFRLSPGFGSGSGETTKTVVVQVIGDLLNEPDETFLLKLSNGTHVLIGCAQAVGTIINDDLPPVLAINDVSVVEGNSGTTNAVLTVSLSAASAQTITATAGADYVSPNATLTLRSCDLTHTIIVPVIGDVLDELDETFLVKLSDATHAPIRGVAGVVTIVDDDAAPALAINDVSVVEG